MNMKILLNLLPEAKKDILVRKFRHRFFLWQSTLVLVLELYYVVILGGIYTIMNYQVNVSEGTLVAFGQYNERAKQLVSYQDEFKRINAETEMVARFQKAHLHWSELFTSLQELTPKGVVIVTLLTKDYTVSIAGQAETRDQFLQFEAALKGDECVSDVRVPISNLFSEKEIDFQVDFKFQKQCLIQP